MYILPSLKTTGNKLSEIKKKNPSNAWKSQEKKTAELQKCLILVQVVSDLHIRKKKIKLEITKIN